MGERLLIKGPRIIDPSQELDQVGDILVENGTITHAGTSLSEIPEGSEIFDGNGLVACPGFIDLHCHLREPGFEHKETIATGTQAAARGGFSTVCCMPNTVPPIDTASVVDQILLKAQNEAIVRVYPIGCVTKGRLGKNLSNMHELAKAGVVLYSDDGSPVYDSKLMRQALTYTRDLGIPISNHCEDLALSSGGVMHEGTVSTRLGLRGIPTVAEEVMASRDIALAEYTGGNLHIAHVSTAGTVELVRRAKEKGINVTAEVSPHHLILTDECVARPEGTFSVSSALTLDAYDTSTKVYPPLRSSLDVEMVIEGLRQGVIDCIATDHAPHDQVSKSVPYEEASSGISVLETGLGSLMSLVHSGQLNLYQLIEKMTVGPARILGKSFFKLATLKPGTPADIVLFDTHEEWVVDAEQFASKGKNTPFNGLNLKGRVVITLVEGKVVYKAGEMKEGECV